MRRDHTEVTDYESKLKPPIGIKGHIFIRIIHSNTISCTPICGEEGWRFSVSLTWLAPTVRPSLEQSFFKLTTEIQLIFHSLPSLPHPKGSTREGKKTLRLLVLREWGLFHFSAFFPPILSYKWLHSLCCWVKFHQYACGGWTAFLWRWLNTLTGWYSTEERAEDKHKSVGLGWWVQEVICANWLTLRFNLRALRVNHGKWN